MEKKLKNQKKKEKYCDNPDSYAYAINVYKIMWLFLIGSFVGYLLETGWYYVLRGHFVNRQGVLFGPFSPIYGVAIAALSVGLYRFKDINALHVMVISGISGGLFEYICSILQEKILGTRSWNYINQPFNINGRTSLQFMIMWGFLGVIIIKHTYPFISKYIEKIPEKIGKILGTILFVFLIVNCVLSICVSVRQKDRRNGIPPRNVIEKFFDSYYTDEKLAEVYTEIRLLDKDGNVIKKNVENTIN